MPYGSPILHLQILMGRYYSRRRRTSGWKLVYYWIKKSGKAKEKFLEHNTRYEKGKH